jgi:hypothetical protein
MHAPRFPSWLPSHLAVALQYDFSLYSGLSGTITAAFFPKGDADAAAIAFW